MEKESKFMIKIIEEFREIIYRDLSKEFIIKYDEFMTILESSKNNYIINFQN